MDITKEQYSEILKKQKDGKLILYIDTAGFRDFFTKIDNSKAKELYGESLYKQSLVIKLTMYILEPISLLLLLVSSILVFKWYAILIIPILILLFGFQKGQSSIGKQDISKPIIFLILSFFIAIFLEVEVWLKIFIFGLAFTHFSSKLLYYLSAFFGFDLIQKNYSFFKLLYEKPEKAMIPMVWAKNSDGTVYNVGHSDFDELTSSEKVDNTEYKPQPFNPIEFPTLVKYDRQKIEGAVQKLMKDRSMTRQQCLVNLEQDLSEIESR